MGAAKVTGIASILRSCRWRGAAACLLSLFLANASAAQIPVDLDLVLAVDVSGSVNQARYELQRSGYAAAFRSADVKDAIQAGAAHAIAVTMVQWTGPTLQEHVVDWTLVKDAASADALAATIEALPRQLFGGGTSISGAIDYAMTLFPQSPYRAPRRVIDVSGDGANNRGRPAEQARDAAVASGIAINGLPILALEPDLEDYYRANVVGGPGAFVMPAAHYEDFAEAILKKLITEIAARDVPLKLAASHQN